MKDKQQKIGQRRSSRREAILHVIGTSKGALTPEQIHMAAEKKVSGLGIATVYRNLKLLHESGLIHNIILPDGQTRYELADKKHHHHFQCDDCGRAFCLDGCVLGMKEPPQLPDGFLVSGHEITYYGTCPSCSPKQ